MNNGTSHRHYGQTDAEWAVHHIHRLILSLGCPPFDLVGRNFINAAVRCSSAAKHFGDLVVSIALGQ
jgi:hypothetical protein